MIATRILLPWTSFRYKRRAEQLVGGIEGVSNRALKLLDKTRRNKHGWGQQHYEALLCGFHFEKDERANHTFYTDPDDASNVVSVPRHRDVRDWVADDAIAAIERRMTNMGVTLDE